jgi:branched-chain amino acid transport system ATP-binding protein
MLNVTNLEVVYNDVVLVLRGISLSVPEGQIVALLGANGAGKTTTMRAITGLLDVHEGDITKGHVSFDGDDITRKDPSRIVQRGISQVMEGRRIFAEMSVDENLRAGAFINTNRKKVDEAYERVMTLFPILGERRRSVAGYMSGGEQQMLAIGRALMARPKLLMLDEPTLGLSPRIASEIYVILRELHKSGMSLLLVSQDVLQALKIAGRAYVIENGSIVMEGKGRDLLENPKVKEAYLGI